MIAHAPTMLGNVTAIEDSEWEVMVASFQAHRKPKKWKWKLRASNGQHYAAINYRGRFWHSDAGVVWEIIPLQEALLREHDEDFMCNGGTPSDVAALYKRGFEVHMAESRTYNHKPKKHPVRISTKAGEPVRG